MKRARTLFIEPGSPWENPYESFNSRFCMTHLPRHLHERHGGKVLAERHRVYHNLDGPHISLGYRAPAEFAASLTEQFHSPTLQGKLLTPQGAEHWYSRSHDPWY